MTTPAQARREWSTTDVERDLVPWIEAGVVGRFEIQLVAAVARLAAERPSASCLLALALAARATRLGHVCLDLGAAHDQVVAAQDDEGRTADLTLPEAESWRAELASSSMVVSAASVATDVGPMGVLRPLVLEGDRLYLQRLWSFEMDVADQLVHRSEHKTSSSPSQGEETDVTAALVAVFGTVPEEEDGSTDLQFVAAQRALTLPVSVISGGPGTGKTHTVARILAAALRLADDGGQVLRVALAAPTGKAATRMKEAIEAQVIELSAHRRITPGQAEALLAIEPTTIHRLLGRKTRTSFRHDRSDPLLHDLVVIDETSMVSLPLLARLLDAVRPEARLVLVGDPFQLASIEAGTVMADMVGPLGAPGASVTAPLARRVTELRRGHRFAEGSATAALALAIRDGDHDRVLSLLAAGDPRIHWVEPDDAAGLDGVRRLVIAAASEVVEAALTGDEAAALAAATRVKVLAAVRRGPLGLFDWTDLITGAVQSVIPAAMRGGNPKVGTPVMVTRNDTVNRLANGDVGVVVHGPEGRRVALAGTGEPRMLAPTRLGEWEPWWAMTIHKSQGSEFPHAVVSLPTVDSPILTRELLYTAVTRAKPEVTVVASEEMLRLAVSRPVARASGLRDRLWPDA